MKRIGIIACANTTKILDCPLSPCLRDFYDRKGEFARYKDWEVELAGAISCQGCLGGLAPESIISKANSLVHYGAEAIHLTYCMKILCPFVGRYMNILEKTYPQVDIVLGTHESHCPVEKTRDCISALLKQRMGENLIP